MRDGLCIKATLCFVFLATFASLPARGELTLHNSHASQRSGTEFRGGSRYVDIHYDASGTTAPLNVTVLLSNDEGATWEDRWHIMYTRID